MSKKIAIITGATGGIGKEFVKQIMQKTELDEIWAVGRSQPKLDKLKDEYGGRMHPICCDLSRMEDIGAFTEQIKNADIDIRYLINNAGLAKMGRYDEFTEQEIAATIDINCKAVVLLCHAGIKKMSAGSRILNISSASSFQPNPYIALYSASKVFEKNYSRALHYELKGTGITCTAVCPGWVDTDLLETERNGKTIRFPGIVQPKQVVALAMKDADKGKDMSVCSLYVKYERLFSKLLPHKIVMKIWAKGVEKYIE